MIKQPEISMDKHQETVYFYICDGKACSEEDKVCCYTQGGDPNFTCRHTSNKDHSFIQGALKDLLPTKFIPLNGNENILFEYFDYNATKDKFNAYFDSLIQQKKESDYKHDENKD